MSQDNKSNDQTSPPVYDANWDRCIQHGALSIGLGMILGSIGSAFLISNAPTMIGTGTAMVWAVKHCRNQYSTKHVNDVDEECTCDDDEEYCAEYVNNENEDCQDEQPVEKLQNVTNENSIKQDEPICNCTENSTENECMTKL